MRSEKVFFLYVEALYPVREGVDERGEGPDSMCTHAGFFFFAREAFLSLYYVLLTFIPGKETGTKILLFGFWKICKR